MSFLKRVFDIPPPHDVDSGQTFELLRGEKAHVIRIGKYGHSADFEIDFSEAEAFANKIEEINPRRQGWKRGGSHVMHKNGLRLTVTYDNRGDPYVAGLTFEISEVEPDQDPEADDALNRVSVSGFISGGDVTMLAREILNPSKTSTSRG